MCRAVKSLPCSPNTRLPMRGANSRSGKFWNGNKSRVPAACADDFLRAELNVQTDLANTFETLLRILRSCFPAGITVTLPLRKTARSRIRFPVALRN